MKRALTDWIMKLLPLGQNVKDTREGKQELESGRPETANLDAEFLGWQKTHTGEVFALYTVTAERHPLYRSTVSEQTLRQQHLETPPTPVPQEQLKRFDREE